MIPFTDEEERIGNMIVNAAFKVHKELRPDLFEKIYENENHRTGKSCRLFNKL